MSKSKRKMLPARVDANKVGFLIDLMGKDCHPLQQFRELTKNSIEAVQEMLSHEPGAKGRIEWSYRPHTYTKNGKKCVANKLTVTDNGTGMTGSEMVKNINGLACSGKKQAMYANFGVGAKITAAKQNPHGVTYRSWKSNEGNEVCFFRDDDTGDYGLETFPLLDDDGEVYDTAHYAPVEDGDKPTLIKSHGTQVVLQGRFEADDTTIAPEAGWPKNRWLVLYLNQRFFRVPNIEISVKESMGNVDSERNRHVHGQEFFLNEAKIASGTVELEGALAHWWILRGADDIEGGRREVAILSGHMAALYQDELHDTMTGRSGAAQLQKFGVTFGLNRIVIYVEPITDKLTPNTGRTHLLIDGSPLPWSDYAEEFRSDSKFPPEIKAFMDELSAKEDRPDYSKRCLEINWDLFDLSAYRASKKGTFEADPDQTFGPGDNPGGGDTIRKDPGICPRPPSPNPRPQQPHTRGGGGSGGTHGDKGSHMGSLKKGGIKARKLSSQIPPKTEWVSPGDPGWDPNLEGCAAMYSDENKLIKINREYPVFVDVRERHVKEHGRSAPIELVCREAVEGYVTRTLIEAVVGILNMNGMASWSYEERKDSLTTRALSVVVSPRTQMWQATKREINTKVGKSRQEEAA